MGRMHWTIRALAASTVGAVALLFLYDCDRWAGHIFRHPSDTYAHSEAAVSAAVYMLPVFFCVITIYVLFSSHSKSGANSAETRCRKCGYILRGISEPRCPECGEQI